MKVSECTRFEALSTEIFGSKQRRLGPMPIPEVQVAVREVLRQSDDNLWFLVPWGSSKQDASPLDLLEFMALKQLRCLHDGLLRFGKKALFVLRIEDVTDLFLFGNERLGEVRDYAHKLSQLSKEVLPMAVQPVFESTFVSQEAFEAVALEHAKVFYDYLRGVSEKLPDGWKGVIPQEQRDYYLQAYKVFYPGQDHQWILAKYFAATLTRVQKGMSAKPQAPHIQISFAKPVPGTPIGGPRLYFRTLPEKFTHNHKAPWIGKGHFVIEDLTNECIPRYNEGEPMTTNLVEINGVQVSCPYLIT